ncbi:MAG TPA: sorbosone dehydrogenase family protein [Terriglobales bacterium]|nr:sorbosone dehydrogenase family protein [Terriglobales bacterium]
MPDKKRNCQSQLISVLALSAAISLAPCAAWAQINTPPPPSHEKGTAPPDDHDWSAARPGLRHRISPSALPQPFSTDSTTNRSQTVAQPQGAWPVAPEGFKVERVATGLAEPRNVVAAPNGDLFIAENISTVVVIRLDANGKLATKETFASGLTLPYGIAFYPPGPNPQYVYVGNTNSLVRFPYRNGDLKARGPAEKLAEFDGGRAFGGGHYTRNLVFSKDGKKLYLAAGSHTNLNDDDKEKWRANVLEFNPDGTGKRVYASGIRNPSGIALNPITNQLWVSVNERDFTGDNMVPDYTTHIVDGGFYGWPWYYIGQNHDPRMKENPEMKSKVIIPDVLLQAHSSPLSLTFYTGKSFPAQYRNGAFIALHGSHNRARRTGYKIVFVPTPGGKATGEYLDFVTGFVVDDTNVWGRPVGITQAKDGSLVFTDDASNSVWRVAYTGEKEQSRASR